MVVVVSQLGVQKVDVVTNQRAVAWKIKIRIHRQKIKLIRGPFMDNERGGATIRLSFIRFAVLSFVFFRCS